MGIVIVLLALVGIGHLAAKVKGIADQEIDRQAKEMAASISTVGKLERLELKRDTIADNLRAWELNGWSVQEINEQRVKLKVITRAAKIARDMVEIFETKEEQKRKNKKKSKVL